MELVVKPFHSLPCHLEVFTINGKDADQYDFGDIFDHNEEIREPYGCGDMYFDSKPPAKEVLDKYNTQKKNIIASAANWDSRTMCR